MELRGFNAPDLWSEPPRVNDLGLRTASAVRRLEAPAREGVPNAVARACR
jgi:hypothetical protein